MKTPSEWADAAYDLCNKGEADHAQHRYSGADCNGPEIPCKAHVAEAIAAAQREAVEACAVVAGERMTALHDHARDLRGAAAAYEIATLIRALAPKGMP